MNDICEKIFATLTRSEEKISVDSFLDTCEKNSLSPLEVDILSKRISERQLFLESKHDSESSDDLVAALKIYHLPYIDNRSKNGVLWVLGGLEIKGYIEQLSAMGYTFHFKESGGKSTKKRAAWWTQ